jgi:hypothetical protein
MLRRLAEGSRVDGWVMEKRSAVPTGENARRAAD